MEGDLLKMEHIINIYYADNARRLRKIVDKILLNYGGLYDMDKDDFYSLANEVFTSVIRSYDNIRPFEVFLYTCLCNKIKSEISKRNTYKRVADRLSVSIDTLVDDNENITVGDIIADNYNIEDIVIGLSEGEYGSKTLVYLNKLSEIQRSILKLAAEGYKPHEIQEKLHISGKEYSDGMMAIHAYRNISILF